MKFDLKVVKGVWFEQGKSGLMRRINCFSQSLMEIKKNIPKLNVRKFRTLFRVKEELNNFF